MRCKAAEHHRVHRTDTGAGQHREHRFRHHRHVQQHPIAAPHPQFLEHGGGRVDLFIDVLPGVDLFPVDFGGHPDQGRLVSLRRQPPVDRVVAKIGLAAYKPLGEWRPREVQDRLEGRLPVDAARLFAPEAIAVMQ
ncbi:hypothetical protein G6F40_015517 [Rhizopus arrhizus]|nr:hypothetical protein G6F40_015517 [Rhizopus arrhizus]